MRTSVSMAVITAAMVAGCLPAAAADLLIYEPEPVAAASSAFPDGFYAGVHLGWGFGMADHQPVDAPDPPFENGYDIGLNGGLIGGQIGGWFHISDGIMGGVQLDASAANITGSLITNQPAGDLTYTINWLATAEGRLGFDAGGFVPYVALGVAAAGGTRTSTAFGGTTASAVHPGLSVGAGVAVMLTDQLSADLEYRWQGFQPAAYDTGGSIPSIAPAVNSIRAGLNFHF